MTTAMPADTLRALHEAATETSDRRRDARWRSALKTLGVVLLLAAIAS
jgi:hypothetical protein